MPRNDRARDPEDDELDPREVHGGEDIDPLSPEFLEDLARDQEDIKKKSGKTDRLKLEVGDDALIRILALKCNKRGHFWRRVAKHWIGKTTVMTCTACTKEVFGGDPNHECPACTIAEKYRESSNRELADAAYQARARDMISVWAIIKERNGRPCRAGTVMEVNLSDKNFGYLLEDYREYAKDKEAILDPVHGYDYKIKREKKNETTLKIERKPTLAIGRDARDAEDGVADIIDALRLPKIKFPDTKEEDEFYDKLKDHLMEAKNGNGKRDDRDDRRGSRDRDDRGRDERPARSERRAPDDLGEDDAPPARGRREEPEDPPARSRREEAEPERRREDPPARSRREEEPERTGRGREEEPARSRREDPPARTRREEEPERPARGREEEPARGRREEEPRRETRREDPPARESRREEAEPERGRREEPARSRRDDSLDDDRAPRRGSDEAAPARTRRDDLPPPPARRDADRTAERPEREADRPAQTAARGDRDDLDEDEGIADERKDHVPPADDIPMRHEGDAGDPDEVPPTPADAPRGDAAGGTRSQNAGMASRLKKAAEGANAAAGTTRRTTPSDVENR